ncbi:30S ribosomal protein S26e [Vulcanisaeta sp. JCM 16159]|uniref:30S ribosomal protein S26e n=1 Tax=Vulcanisaeta sp. JCM 16159 TaxID=1295371 RepID=UPI0006D28C6F|nr:30S ribosomal protein S26e [Vulcanisaeta sp. JCM 16159]
MPKKRKNRGRHKGDKGKEPMVYCDNCGKLVPRSKAVRVTVPYSPVPGDLARELEKQGAIVPRYYVTKTYCINCAIYLGILKVRSEDERKKKAALSRAPIRRESVTAPSASKSAQTQTQTSAPSTTQGMQGSTTKS